MIYLFIQMSAEMWDFDNVGEVSDMKMVFFIFMFLLLSFWPQRIMPFKVRLKGLQTTLDKVLCERLLCVQTNFIRWTSKVNQKTDYIVI